MLLYISILFFSSIRLQSLVENTLRIAACSALKFRCRDVRGVGQVAVDMTPFDRIGFAIDSGHKRELTRNHPDELLMEWNGVFAAKLEVLFIAVWLTPGGGIIKPIWMKLSDLDSHWMLSESRHSSHWSLIKGRSLFRGLCRVVPRTRYREWQAPAWLAD